MSDCGPDGDLSYSDKLTEIYTAGVQRMAKRLVNGDMTLDEWHQQMKDAIDGMFTKQAMAGVNGDKGLITEADQDRIRQNIIGQYGYLDDFATKIQTALDSDGSLGFVENQAGLYAKSSQTEYWRQTTSDADLPTVPGEDCEGLGNCGCKWVCRNGKWYWELGETDHCKVCLDHAAQWSPYEPGD